MLLVGLEVLLGGLDVSLVVGDCADNPDGFVKQINAIIQATAFRDKCISSAPNSYIFNYTCLL